MGALDDIENEFQQSLADCRALFAHSVAPIGTHTNAGIESAFLQAFKSWEVLLEEAFLAYLTGETSRAGNRPQTLMTVSSIEDCRRIVNGGRAFSDWANAGMVADRITLFFSPGSLDTKLAGSRGELSEALACRNAIAHSSGKAAKDLAELWVRKVGTPMNGVRPADLLRLTYSPNPPDTWFDRYVTVFEVLGRDICAL